MKTLAVVLSLVLLGAAPARKLMFNGKAATANDLEVVAMIEKGMGHAIPDGAYWYDTATGAAGVWGGPTLGFLPPGLTLGGALPAEASGGGKGQLTGVFINNREIHPQDRAALAMLIGQVWPGRWWVDAHGNSGAEGGPALFNLLVLARQQAAATGKKGSYYRTDGQGKNVFAGGGCVAVNGTRGSGEDKSSYSYYSSGCE